MFNFLSGRLCLAFCATVGERWRGNYERLRTPEDLARWFIEAGMLEDRVTTTPAGLCRARALREAIYRAAKAIIAGRASRRADEAIINRFASATDLVPCMSGGAVTWHAPARGAEMAALSAIARDAIGLLTGPAAARIRECESSECGLLFVDTSRPNRRRWCSSAACGGRERSAAYRRRSQAAGAAGTRSR